MTIPIRLAADSRMEAIAQLKKLQDDLEAQFAGQHALSVAGRMSHFGIKMKEEGQRTAPFQTGTLQMSHRSVTTLQKLDAHVHQVTTSIFIDPPMTPPQPDWFLVHAGTNYPIRAIVPWPLNQPTYFQLFIEQVAL